MDVKKIGAFIADQRHQKQMTQKQLGEALGISDKTVSKWECGYGLPDISMIMPLCTQLEINVNELLSGERLAQEEYHEKAEENMMHLIRESRSHKRPDIIINILGTACIIGTGTVFFSILADSIRSSSYILFNSSCFVEVLFILMLSLWTTGNFKNLGHAFLFLVKNPKYPQQLKHAILAVSAAQRSLLYGGAFCSLFDLTRALSDPVFVPEDLLVILCNLSVSFTALFYGVFGALLMEPVKCRLKKKQIDL